jgi:hypothetical protein
MLENLASDETMNLVKLYCDACDKPITRTEQAIAAWNGRQQTQDAAGTRVWICHKGCARQVETAIEIADGFYMNQPLDELCRQLASNAE